MRNRLILIFIMIFVISACPADFLEGYQEGSMDSIINKCRDCKLHLINEESIRGRLVKLDNESLEIDVQEKLPKEPFQIRSHRQTVPIEEVFSLQCGDPVYDGAIGGFIIGGVAGALVAGIMLSSREPHYEYDTSSGEILGWGILIGGGIGSAAGFLTDLDNGFRMETIDIHEWLREE